MKQDFLKFSPDRVKSYGIWLCVACLLFVLLVLPLSGSTIIYVKAAFPINILYGISGIVLLLFWHDAGMVLRSRTFTPLLLLFVVVLICGGVSTHYSFDSYETWQSVRRLAFDGVFMFCVYVLLKQLDSRGFAIFFLEFLAVVFVQPVATIVDGVLQYLTVGISANMRATGFSNTQALVYSFVLLLAFSLGLASVWLVKSRIRIVVICLLIIAIFAIALNNSRLVFFAATLGVFVPFLLFSFPYKKWILTCVLGLGIIAATLIYSASAHWHERYNFRKMVDNLSYVASFQPAEMGRFDRRCVPNVLFYNPHFDYTAPIVFRPYFSRSVLTGFYPAIDESLAHVFILEFNMRSVFAITASIYNRGYVLCSNYSFPSDELLSWEHSSLARISMNKSALQAIMQNPFRPNGLGFLGYTTNSEQIFPKDSIHHSYILSLLDRDNGYPHPHNQILSLVFELSIVGLSAIGGFLFLVFFRHFREIVSIIQSNYLRSNSLRENLLRNSPGILFVSLAIFIVCLSMAMLFDCLLWRWNTTYLFVLFGIALACRDMIISSKTH